MKNNNWPQSTYIFEKPDVQHYMGSHWDPFNIDIKYLMQQLPLIVEEAVPAIETKMCKDRFVLPENWPEGIYLDWPIPRAGARIGIILEDSGNALKTIFPFCSEGSQYKLEIEQINVWHGGAEAQISADINGMPLDFFDTTYLLNRARYEAGRTYDFLLIGMAYDAKHAATQEIPVEANSKLSKLLSEQGKSLGAQDKAEQQNIYIDESTMMFYPIEEWDVDDYFFRGPVESVRQAPEILGTKGWIVRIMLAQLMLEEDEVFSLDILITENIWNNEQPPRAGDALEGHLWLQGRLWH